MADTNTNANQDDRPCAKEVLEMLTEHTELMRQVVAGNEQASANAARMVELLEHKWDALITTLAELARAKDMIPVSTFKWLVLFVILFSFTTFFGFAYTDKLIDRIPTIVQPVR